MQLSKDGIELLKSFEGYRLTAYKDGGGIWTIGYGHTGPDVHEGLTITAEQAVSLLEADLKVFECCVNSALPGLSQNQFDACVCLAYNIGCHRFKTSGVAKAISKDPNAKNIEAAWLAWSHINGKPSNGLLNRRKKEFAYFMKAHQ